MAAEESQYTGKDRRGRGGGGINTYGGKGVWRWARGYLGYIDFIGCGCTEPLKGRERGRRITLG